eukprot:CAMPEP_0115005240 /NCGR_PEP_ID=MMETSP0216-20121206/19735_1 /TAXON_ID=223996 /ORGANISM="Protocruzia adherens, Strain Boccale" /LENGTH=438 /DNA_ID=CAMNT_0002371491 /DNA_START=191 /DNA_END=1507 /DNA_ORIENTATION=-
MSFPFDKTPCKIFVGGLSPSTTQQSLFSKFGHYGEVIDCVLMVDKRTGRSRGFGFVTLKDSSVVDIILQQKPQMVDGKEVDCKRAIPRDQTSENRNTLNSIRTKKMFVGGLPPSLSQEEFTSYFSVYGAIVDSVIMFEKDTGKHRGFGFITFEDEDSVELAIHDYRSHIIHGKWVEVKKATPKDMSVEERTLLIKGATSTTVTKKTPSQNHVPTPNTHFNQHNPHRSGGNQAPSRDQNETFSSEFHHQYHQQPFAMRGGSFYSDNISRCPVVSRYQSVWNEKRQGGQKSDSEEEEAGEACGVNDVLQGINSLPDDHLEKIFNNYHGMDKDSGFSFVEKIRGFDHSLAKSGAQASLSEIQVENSQDSAWLSSVFSNLELHSSPKADRGLDRSVNNYTYQQFEHDHHDLLSAYSTRLDPVPHGVDNSSNSSMMGRPPFRT